MLSSNYMAKKRITRRKYTDKEKEIIISLLSKYVGNFSIAFEIAAKRLGRHKSSVKSYYQKYIKDSSDPILVIITRDGILVNTKVVPRNSKRKKEVSNHNKITESIIKNLLK